MNIPIKTGKVAEMRVVAELIERGHSPYLPVVDDHGVDIMLSSGTRIQVKSANLTKHCQSKHLGYNFRLGSIQVGSVNNRKYVRRKVAYSEECDFIIFVGLTENRFWVVPSYLLDGRNCLIISNNRSIVRAEAVQGLRDQGLYYDQIAKELGVSIGTAWKRVNQCEAQKGGFVRAVRLCEGRWDYIGGTQPSPAEEKEFQSYRKTVSVDAEQEQSSRKVLQ